MPRDEALGPRRWLQAHGAQQFRGDGWDLAGSRVRLLAGPAPAAWALGSLCGLLCLWEAAILNIEDSPGGEARGAAECSIMARPAWRPWCPQGRGGPR